MIASVCLLFVLSLSVDEVLSICVGNNAKYRYIESSTDRKRNAVAGPSPSPTTPAPTPTTTTTTTTSTTATTTTTTTATTTASTIASTTSTTLATSTAPNNIEERYFNQLIDHFDPRNNAMFAQKYLIDWGTLDPAANHSQTPVFLIISGEELLDADGLLSNEAAALARKNNAILIALEHRYYGDSIVYNLTQHGLRYLTVEQALADVSNFQAQLSLQGYSGQWFAFGCSYGGVLAAWFRLKYPQQVVASLAASSPVQTIVSFYQLDQLVAAAAGPQCARSLRHATASVEDSLLVNATQTMIDFGCGSLADNVDFLYVIADIVAYGIQMDSKYHFQDAMCHNFTNAPDMFLYQVYRDYAAFAFQYTNTTCDDWALSTFTNTSPSRRYGGNTDFVGTNVIFSNGDNDPWRALSVLSPLGPTVPAIVISGQAHCANWYSAAPGDSPALERGRQLVSSYVSYFVNPGAICGKCKNNATCVVTTVGSNSANVTADCTCLEGWVGDDCDQNVYVTAGFYIFIITAGCAIAFGLLGVVIGRILVLRSKPQVI